MKYGEIKVNAIEKIIKHFNKFETEDIVKRYYSMSIHILIL